MNNFYQNDQERWDAMTKLRYDVAKFLNLKPGSSVLSVLVGYADFSRAIAKTYDTKVTAIEIVDVDIEEAKKRIEKEELQDSVEIIKMDATKMTFPDNSFDYVVNFIGWEDLTAISGEEGVEKVFGEMVRVLKKDGTLLITFIPQTEASDEISKKDRELEEYKWLSEKKRRFYNKDFFIKLFEKYNIEIVDTKPFNAEKNRTKPEDAKGILKWFCDNYKKFYGEDVEMRPYEDIINKFGEFIDKYGIRDKTSNVIVLIGKNVK